MLLIAAVGLFRLRTTVRQTTLTTVWPWMWVAWSAALVGWALQIAGNTALVSYGDYFTAVAVLSPPMASLGARRPTCRSWPFFVLLPMFAVLLWPAISVGFATGFSRPLELETPAIVMYLLVLVMSWGNYALGRSGSLVIVFALLLAGMVCRNSAWLPHFALGAQRTLLLIIAVLLILKFRNSHRASRALIPYSTRVMKPTLDRFDSTLMEFGELYGLVWGLRLEDRLNVFAKQGHWPGEFAALRGLWKEPLTEEQQAEIEQAFRWLLRRFVDPPWLDARLKHHATPTTDAFRSSIDS